MPVGSVPGDGHDSPEAEGKNGRSLSGMSAVTGRSTPWQLVAHYLACR